MTHPSQKSQNPEWVITAGVAALLIVGMIIMHLGIIANPGFFSHDEWQKFDHIQSHGLTNFLQAYGRVYAGNEFGFPIRPLGFLQQGISSIWMQNAPIVPHAFDVVLHTGITLFVFFGLSNIGANRWKALLVAALFGLSPLTTMATGWVAASFDQWYTLFVCIACWLSYRVVLHGLTLSHALGVLVAVCCAILSKETALITPVAMALAAGVARLQHSTHRVRPAMLALLFALAIAPLAAYMLIRLPALLNSFAGQSTTVAYTPSAWNIPRNLVYYAAYPFLPTLSELGPIALMSRTAVSLAIVSHLVFLAGIWFYFGRAYALLYVVGYYIFLAPVLSVNVLGSHYLYGCALPMSIALGALIWRAAEARRYIALAVSVVTVLVFTIHMLNTQRLLYIDGVCQRSFLSSLDSRLNAAAIQGTSRIDITPLDGAPAHVGIRSIFGRERYSNGKNSPSVKFVSAQTSKRDETNGIAQAVMTIGCEVR